MLAEQEGGFPAAQPDAAEGQDGAVPGQGGELGLQVLPRDPPVSREGEQGVFPGFPDIKQEVAVTAGGEL